MRFLQYVFLLILITTNFSAAQNRNSVWCFGDSAGIDFSNITSPQVINTSLNTRGSCVSIADTNGSLLYYAETNGIISSNSTIIYNSLNQLMQNGDSIFGQFWYHELITMPSPGNDSLYYLFSIGVSSVFGLKYSLINMKANSGLGSVIQKNIQLQTFPMVDCLTAIKHGNGRDWWIIFRRWDQFTMDPNNEFHSYLISPAGITNYSIQMIGSSHMSNQGELTFSPNGEKLINTDGVDLLEIIDFNRCTGILSNPVVIHPAGNFLNYNGTWSSAFSPNGNVLYVSTSKDTNHVYQLDLTAPNIYASRLDLDTFYRPPINPGSLKLAPDGKIYLSCAYDNGIQFNYPYDDSVYNYVNMNLSVIHYPDSIGTACGYSPFSFYLGGKRTYYGLPNNPDYDLPPLAGSPCDSLTSISETPQFSDAEIFVYYTYDWQTAFINANKIKGTSYHLEVFDLLGKSIFCERGKILPPYFTKNLNCSGFAKGMYVVNLITDKEKLSKKFVVQ